LVATAIWLPCVHLFFRKEVSTWRQPAGVSSKARALVTAQLVRWNGSGVPGSDQSQMRRTNAEWDLMGRGFLVWSLANLCLRESGERDRYLKVVDDLIDSTLRLERQSGPAVFLMRCARARPFQVQPMRSLFVDSEIAFMLGARCLIADRPDYRLELASRVREMTVRLERSPILAAESYPDECWTFDHTIALAAMRMEDRLAGTNHRDLASRWIAIAKERLIDRKTGLLVSSYSLDGKPQDGPEGSIHLDGCPLPSSDRSGIRARSVPPRQA
jgi:hypothetical protein